MMSVIIQELRIMGYLVFHDYDPMKNESGFPDLAIVGFGRVWIIELKAGKNKATEKQNRWIEEFSSAGINAQVYYVENWYKGGLRKEIIETCRSWKRERRAQRKLTSATSTNDVH